MLAKTKNQIDHLTNGVTTVFPYDFFVFDKSELRIYLTADDLSQVEIAPEDFTADGFRSENGGNVTILGSAIASGATLSIVRETKLDQPRTIENHTKFNAAVLMAMADKAMRGTQDLRQLLRRSPLFQIGGPLDMVFPLPAEGTFLGWNSENKLANRGADWFPATGDMFSSREALRAWTATATPKVGGIVEHPSGRYRYDGLSTKIDDMPGYLPLSPINPRQFADDLSIGANGRAALQKALQYHFENEGTELLIDGIVVVDQPIVLTETPRNIRCPGMIVLSANFVRGDSPALIILGAGANASIKAKRTRGKLDFFIDGEAYFGTPKGTWEPVDGGGPNPFPSVGVSAGDNFRIKGSGTTNGVAFQDGDCIKALVSTPSTTTLAGNWLHIPKFDGVRVDGIALPFAAIEVEGWNWGGNLLCIHGNAERTDYRIAGYLCHNVCHEESFVDDDDNVHSPENNRIFIRGASCGQAYTNSGTVVADVEFQFQFTLENFFLAAIDIEASRRTKLSGCVRAHVYIGLRINQSTSAEATGVICNDLHLIQGTTNFVYPPSPFLLVEAGQMLSGDLHVDAPDPGGLIRELEGADINIIVNDLHGGVLMTLGDETHIVKRCRFVFFNNRPNASADKTVQINNVADCEIECRGVPLKIESATEQTRLKLTVGANYLTHNGGVEIVYSGADVEFVGSVTLAQLTAYPFPTAGMRAYLNESNFRQVFHNGTSWQRPVMTAV